MDHNAITKEEQDSHSSYFHHQRLDHGQPSIRLVKLLPQLTSNGFILCEVSLTTTGSQIVYRCLSYQWGEPNAATSRVIEINGALFSVRKNLYDFLRTLQSDIGYNTILDALCIDQQNTLERNHQVAQMGTIYSKAEEVVVWLGRASLAKNRINNLLDLASSRGSSGKVEPGEDSNVSLHDRRNIGRRIVRNEYWNRAWITQEIALAQSVSIMVNNLLFGFSELVDLLSSLDIPWRYSHLSQFVGIRNGTFDFSSRSLLDLLNHFRDRQCTLPQDRVFSLLSMCSGLDGALPVDYHMSKDQLANRIMKLTSHGIDGPRNGCVCSSTIVARSLEMHGRPVIAGNLATGTYLEFQVTHMEVRRVEEVYLERQRSALSICQDFGMKNVQDAFRQHAGLNEYHKQLYGFQPYKTQKPPRFALAEVIKSYIDATRRLCTETPSTTLEFAPGCSIEVLDEKANVCVVRIAFRVLPTLFHDVTRLCDDPDYSMHEDDAIVRRVGVVYEPARSSV